MKIGIDVYVHICTDASYDFHCVLGKKLKKCEQIFYYVKDNVRQNDGR